MGVVALVAMAAVVVANPAPGGEDIQAVPPILVIDQPNATPAMGIVQIVNPGVSPVTVSTATFTCDSTMTLNPANGGVPFTIPAGQQHPVALSCPPTLAVGMHRCTFNFTTGSGGASTSFVGVCKTETNQVLSFSPPSLAFGMVTVGTSSPTQTLSLSNMGSGGMDVTNLQLQVDDPNFLVGMPCNPDSIGCDAFGVGPMGGSNANIQVLCRPTKVGTFTGHLHAMGSNGLFPMINPILSCTGVAGGAPAIQVAPTTVDLGDIEVTGGSASQSVNIKNVGTGSGSAHLTVTSLQLSSSISGAAADWNTGMPTGKCSVFPCDLFAGESIDVQVGLDPSAIGPRTSTLTVNYTDPAVKQALVSLDGVGRGPTLDLVSSPIVDFGVVPLNMAVMQAFTVQNNGNRALVDGTIAMPGAPFTLPALPFSVPISPPNTDLAVTCQSATPTVANKVVHVASPTALNPGGFDVTLKCEVRDTQMVVMPTSLMLGEIRTGTAAVHKLFNVTSLAGPIQVSSVALAQANPNLAIVSPAGMATTPFTIDLLVDPTTDGALDNSLTITASTAGVMPISVPITGLVTTPAYAVPDTVQLGTFCTGQSTSASNVVLTSTGTATITLAPPALSMMPSPFDLSFASPSVYPALLPGGGQAMVQVTPKRSMAAGPVDDMLVWSTDATPTTRTTLLSAKFVDDGGAIAPATVDFGRAPIHAVTPAKKVTLQNCDVQEIMIDKPTFTGPFDVDGVAPMSLAPGESATIGVVFQPTKVGTATGTLAVTSPQLQGVTLSVDLSGEGIVDGTGGDDDDAGGGQRTSFYACGACNSGSPSGGIAIVAALGFVVRRKRRR